MKHILKFNEELSSSTYRKVANLLATLGHTKRAEKITTHAKDVELIEKNKKWKDNIEEYKQYGKFTFDLFEERTGGGIDKRSGVKIPLKLSNLLMTGDFYLDLNWSADSFFESVTYDRSKNKNNFKGIFEFTFAGIPVNDKTKLLCEKNLPDPEFSNGSFWLGFLGIRFVVTDSVKFTDIYIDEYDENISGIPKISDRKTAINLKNLLYNIFSEKIDYPSGYTDIVNMYDKIEHDLNAPEIDLISEYGFNMSQLADFVKSFPVNKLYSE